MPLDYKKNSSLVNSLTLMGFIYLLLQFIGCSIVEPHIDVIGGNFFYSNGDFVSATQEYLQAMESSRHIQYISYNLGNVYHSLGDTENARRAWDIAKKTEDSNILFRTAFNIGVQLAEQNRYEEAYRHFREALRIDGGNRAAKHNLEVALRNIETSNTSLNLQTTTSDTQKDLDENIVRILEYMRRKEVERRRTEQLPINSESQRDW